MKLKRSLTMLLCGIMLLSATIGCCNASSEGSGEFDEITEIIWQYPCAGSVGVGFQDMEDALNALMEKDIGVHVTFEPVGLIEAQQQAMLAVSGGEQLDVCLSAFVSIAPLVASNLIIPLNDLVKEYGQDIIRTGVPLEYGYCGGDLYGISPVTPTVQAFCYLIKTDYLDKYGIEIDQEKYYSFDELGEIFDIIKSGEGSSFYCFPVDPAISTLNVYTDFGCVGGAGNMSCGVVMFNNGFDSTDVVNIYETEEYAAYAQLMYEWAQKGYISPEAAVMTESTDTLISTDNYLGTFYFDAPNNADTYGSLQGVELTRIGLQEISKVITGGLGCLWSIPITCERPDKAMQAINYIYANDEANWIIQYGLEDVSYEVLEKSEEGFQIRMLSDDITSLPYYNPYGLWGNQFHYPAVYPTPANRNMLLGDFEKSVSPDRIAAFNGFSLVQDSIATEVASVATVIEQYDRSFNAGALDPARALPEFINALKAAGIDTIIAEAQDQMDEFMAEKK